MLKRHFVLGCLFTKPSLVLLLTMLSLTSNLSVFAQTEKVPPVMPHLAVVINSQPLVSETDSINNVNESVTSIDPLDSPYPVPWTWITKTYDELNSKGSSGIRYYRTPSLVSPDGKYSAYSRIKMEIRPEFFLSRVSSVMFLENLQTGDLRTITASSPLADHPLQMNEEADQPGAMAILIPVSWSANGDRILARQFEGFLSTSDASDYAVIWDRHENKTYTLSPNNIEYSNAVLLGWSRVNPNQVLFRAGELGDEEWPILAVNSQGDTLITKEDQPITYGQMISQVWTGPQSRW